MTPSNSPDYKSILLRLIGSLTLCDHMGDVSNDVSKALSECGIEIEWDEWHDLGKALHGMGVTTLHGTELWSKEDEDAE